jgi:hypothetical protein
MRILIFNLGDANDDPNDNNDFNDNRLVVAKPVIMGASWRGISLDGSNAIKAAEDRNIKPYISIMEGSDGSLRTDKINRLHESGINQVLEVKWDGMTSAGADGRISTIPLTNYKVLSFYVKGPLPSGSKFHFLIARGPNDYPNKTALTIELDGSNLAAGWNSVEVHYRDKKVFINGASVRTEDFRYDPNVLRQGSADGDLIADGQSAYAAAFVTGLSTSESGTFSIDEICLEEPAPSYRVNGGATLDWRHPEALVTVGGKDVVSGAVFSTALESAARGDPFESGGETFAGMQSRSSGELTVLDTQLSGNLNVMDSNNVNYWSAGHGIKRSFGPLSVSETFNTAPPPNDATMNHSLSLGLSTPVYGNISSSIDYRNRQLSRLWSASTGLRPELNGHPGFSLEGTLNYLEKDKGEKVLGWMPNYGETWAQSWTVMLPDDGSGSTGSIQSRDMRGRAGFSLDRRPVGAELSFEGTSFVSMPLWLTRSGSSARAEAPFGFGNIQGRLRSQRDISRSMNLAGDNIGDDMAQYGESLSDTSPLWREIPIYALFNSNLDSSMDSAVSNSGAQALDTMRFHEVLALNLLFPERYDALSLIVPVSHFTQLDRTMEQRMDTRLDVLTVSSGFGFTSTNLFGAMGTHPVFDFYRNDELRHSITGIISFPRGEEALWRIQAEQNILLFGFKGAELGIQNTYTVNGGSASGWVDSFALLWTVPREQTLLSGLYSKGMEKMAGNSHFPSLAELAKTDYERFFRESLEFVLDHSGEYSVYSFFLGHESVVRIIGSLTLTGFAKLGLERDEAAEATSLLLSFGTTLTVSF